MTKRSKKAQRWQAKTLSEMFASIARGQEYVNVTMQRSTWEELKYFIELALREEDMATKQKIVAPAVKDKKTGVIIEAPSKKLSLIHI